MPNSPAQQSLALFEVALLVAGAVLFLRLVFSPTRRGCVLTPRELPPWPVTLPEFVIFVVLIFACGTIAQLSLNGLLRGVLAHAIDRDGLQLCLNGFGFDGGGLIGWLIFPMIRKNWYADYGATPPPASVPAPLPWPQLARAGIYTLLAAMPVIILLNFGWTFVLQKLGLPEEPQDLIAVFANTKSSFVIAGMLIVACVVAPIFEELLFRGGLYRLCRQNHRASIWVIAAAPAFWGLHLFYTAIQLGLARHATQAALTAGGALLLLGASILFFVVANRSPQFVRYNRPVALILSGCLFGLAHLNWASFLPLSVLGMVLALAYEATGDIRVPIIAHGLFNLNTIFLVLSGIAK